MADQETAKPAIKHRYTGAVLFEGDAGMTTRQMLEKATAAKANLIGSNLIGSNLIGSNLSGANLSDAYLRGAYLSDAKGADLAIARTRIVGEGQLIGWKKCRDGAIVKLSIPADAKRSHAFGRKCRAEFADVLEVFGDKAISMHDGNTEYIAGQRVTPDAWCDDWTQECASGIHFYISRIEAENHY